MASLNAYQKKEKHDRRRSKSPRAPQHIAVDETTKSEIPEIIEKKKKPKKGKKEKKIIDEIKVNEPVEDSIANVEQKIMSQQLPSVLSYASILNQTTNFIEQEKIKTPFKEPTKIIKETLSQVIETPVSKPKAKEIETTENTVTETKTSTITTITETTFESVPQKRSWAEMVDEDEDWFGEPIEDIQEIEDQEIEVPKEKDNAVEIIQSPLKETIVKEVPQAPTWASIVSSSAIVQEITIPEIVINTDKNVRKSREQPKLRLQK